jgi:sugar-specific transcriptional regulator TrmB
MRKLGFTDYETKIYIRLLQESPATAYELSKTTGVPRPNTYNVLDSLTQRNVVLPVSAEPARYVAVAPDIVFRQIVSSTREICDDLSTKLAVLSEPEDSQLVWTTKGDARVHDKVQQMIEGARTQIWIKAGDEILRRHRDTLAAAAARGVGMIVILFGADAAEFKLSEKVHVYLHEGNGKRMGVADNLFTLIVDQDEVMMANAGRIVVGSHTKNHSIVTMALGLLRHEYYIAELFMRLGGELTAAFGPHLSQLRAKCFTQEQQAAFQEHLDLVPEIRAPRRKK